MGLYSFIKPFGIITYLLLIMTAVSGMMGWKLKHHKMLAIIAIIMATLHAAIVISID